MNTNGVRAAIYLRVSRDDQTTENQRLVLARVAEHRGWLIALDRLGRSVLHVAIDAAGIRLYCDQQGIDSSTPMGRAMIQMASVFGEQERSMLRARVLAGLDRVRQQGKKLGRPKVSPKVERAPAMAS